MKKAFLILLCLGIVFAGILFSGCSVKKNSQTINYQRRLQNYLPSNSATSNKQPTGTIDLSEGPKLKYDAKLGPGDLDFDIKIRNPYKYE